MVSHPSTAYKGVKQPLIAASRNIMFNAIIFMIQRKTTQMYKKNPKSGRISDSHLRGAAKIITPMLTVSQ